MIIQDIKIFNKLFFYEKTIAQVLNYDYPFKMKYINGYFLILFYFYIPKTILVIYNLYYIQKLYNLSLSPSGDFQLGEIIFYNIITNTR